MSRFTTWDDILEKINRQEQLLQASGSAIARAAEQSLSSAALHLAQPIMDLPESLYRQTQQAYDLLNTAAISPLLDSLTQLERQFSQTYTVAEKLINAPAIQTYLDQIDRLTETVARGTEFSLTQMSNILELYNSPAIIRQIEQATAILPNLDEALLRAAKLFDTSSVKVEDERTISYEGVSYSIEALDAELQEQIKVVEENKPTLRERFEALQQKLWLLLLVFNLIMFLPQLPETAEYYRNVASQIELVVMQKSQICFTIKEKAVLREEPNSKAKRLVTLPYDTPLEIIESVPRWYQVKYTDENGTEIIGWISKISVESEV